jgi:hypothetical protein
MTLTDLQRAFQRHVLEQDAALLQYATDTDDAPAKSRAAIYREAYRLRLRDALASNYPRIKQLLGTEAFEQIADAYIDAKPSTFGSIRWFGGELAAELERTLPAQPWLYELARWEWTIATAFDAADVATLSVADLSTIPGDHWPALRFEFHPSVRCLQMRTNAPQLFKALTEDAEVPQPQVISTQTFWLIWRQKLTTQYRSMPASEAHALNTLLAAQTFEAMCTTLCNWHAPEEIATHAATLLHTWIAEGLVCNAVIANETA